MRRKQIILMLLCLLCVGTASAQLSTGKFYRIQDNTRTKYLTIRSYGANSGGAFGTVPVLAKEEGNEDQVWELEAVDAANNQYKLKSKSGYYLQCRSWCCDAVSSGGSTITIAEESTEEYHLKNGASYFKVEDIAGDGGTAHPFCDASAGHANIVTWSFVEVPDYEVFATKVTVAYKYMIGDKEYTTVPVEQDVNSEINVPSQAFLTVLSTEGTVGDADCVITVNCSENLPFVVTSDLADPVWQVVEMHRYEGNRYWEYQADQEVNVGVAFYTGNQVGLLADKTLWCFTGDLISGFKIYNKAVMSENASWTLNATSGNATMGDAAEGNDVWYLVASSAASGANVVCFTHDKANYMNQSNGKIAYYTDNDNGSTCYIFQPKDFILSAVEGMAAVVKGIVTIPEGAIGVIDKTSAAATTFKNLYNTVSAAANPNISDLLSLVQSAQELQNTVVLPTSGYYFIYGTGTGNNASWRLTYDGTKCYALPLAEEEKLGAKHVWSFDPIVGEDGFKLKSCNLNKYLTLAAAAPASDVTSDFAGGHKFTFASNGSGHFTIKNGNGNVVRTEGSGAVNYWSGETNETWYLVPATAIDLKISAAGYATANYPFAVTIPSGVKAYTGKLEGNEVVLTQVAATVLPANTPVVLEAAEGTYNFAIAYDNADAPLADNDLIGANAPATVAASDNAYILANVDGVVKFYLLSQETRTLQANKAHVVVPASAGSQAFALNFGGVTGIESVEAADANAPVYDLSGRKVANPAKGGVYIKNGKKIIF